ncbi:hypothetical protein QYE76_025481 [Lolium multiflorum]|uniref:CCHC-type domain-containing protein n=1 Tax=Lolium multiflorum TaxID=4521 RepID=A0AAD8RHZ9_LOLMU|nr:hypothetical protein QYE76_025481 [Lolium multiflorum]
MNRVDEASHNHEASHNLALKARADHESKEDYEIEEDEEMTSTSDIATDFAFFAKKYKAKFPMLLNDKKKKRTCYNCDEDNHFANECPYEKRVDKPKFIKGVKPRLKPNPINDRYKKNKGRAFVGAEYLSDEEEEDEEKEAGVAGLAYSKPGSLFTYDYSKDYSTENDVGSSFMARTTQDDDSDDSPSSPIIGSCLMARETKVMEPPPSLSSVLDDENEDQEELTMLKELYDVRCTLRGEALVKLTKELAKFTTAKNKMGLDDLLSKQRSNNQKYGLGYTPKSHKKNNYKKEKPAQDKNKKGYSSGGPKWVFDSGCTNHMTGGKAGKQLKKKHPIKSIVTTSRPLELLHLDLFGPSHYDTLGGSKYGLVIVDDYSRYSWVFLLKSKDETHREFITFAKKAQRSWSGEPSRGQVAKRGRTADPPRRSSSRAPPQAQQGTDTGSSARGRTKSVATKRKDKNVVQEDDEAVPTINVGAANRLEWQEWRTLNPYRFEKPTYTRSDKAFWTNTQAALWEGFYDSHEFMKHGNIVSPKAINPEELALHEATKYRFVVQTLRSLGLYDLVCLKPDDTQDDPTFCPLLVRQFHCTVFFHDDEDRTLTWMTGKTKYSCSYSQFRAAMGCGDDSDPGYKIHSRSRCTRGDISFCYPANPTPGPPTISGMYYSYLVLAKLFRENLISKSGDHSEVRNYHLNLMYYCHPDRVRKIDGCDLIYCELKRAIMDRMTPNYAQYVQRLINYIVPAPRNVIGEKVIMDPFKFPIQEATRPDVPSMMPTTERRSKAHHDHDASSSHTQRSQHGAARFFTCMFQMCKRTHDVAHQTLT